MQHLKGYDEGVTFSINGKIYQAGKDVETDTSLNTYIRKYAGLKGTKYMCREGGCGACVVAVTLTHPVSHHDVTMAVNSCLVPILACHGMAITTIEGIGDKLKGYNRVQKTLAAFNGTQCGYCSPGMVMNMYSLLKYNPNITMEEVENSFGGSICRCTGYRPILDAFKSLTLNATAELKEKLIDIEDLSKVCSLHDSECKENCKNCPGRRRTDSEEDYSNMFLETAMASKTLQLRLGGGRSSWYRVETVHHIFELFDYIGEVSYTLVAGNTAQGVYKEPEPHVFIDIADVSELRGCQIYSDRIELGANMTLTEMINLFESVSVQNHLMFGYTKLLAEHIELVANVPVRNRGTLAGNLMIKWRHHEFPSDLFLLMVTCGASITIRDRSGIEDTVPIIHLLEYDMYKKVILNVTIPALSSNHYILRTFKIMPRSQNVHALVNAGFLFRYDWNNHCIVEEQPNIIFGHINPTFVHAYQTESYLVGKSLLSPAVLRDAILILSKELQPNDDPPEASPLYRLKLAVGLFYKFILGVNGPEASRIFQSGGENLVRPLSSGKQTFPKNPRENPVHLAIPKLEGLPQCSGEAEYVDDMPNIPGELHGALVLAEKARARIDAIDPTEALHTPGVIAFYSSKDIPGTNSFVIIDGFFSVEDEELFCSGEVLYAGQPVGIIVAETHDLAVKAAKLVKMKYSNTRKPLLTIKEVLESGDSSRVKPMGKIEPVDTKGNVVHKITGEFMMESQYHYTMELQTCLSVPIEDGLNVYATTQWMHNTQAVIANVMAIPLNSINVHVKRVGGAYGAKITRNSMVSAACSLAALKLQKPVRMVLDLETNMRAVGKRCPALSKYEVDVDENGEIQKLQVDMYEDMGCSYNDNVVFLTRDGIKSCYDATTWTVNFFVVKTDVPSSTWVRAPGSTEGMATVEHILEHIAHVCKRDPLDVRRVNVSSESKSMVEEILNDVLTSSDYKNRLTKVQRYNVANRWKKKGIAVMPMKFQVLFLPGFHSMVSIFHNDGTVAVSTGGIEIGQGINTKVAQICAYSLGIDISMIKIKPSYNVISPNDKMTAGSMASDTVTYATLRCCEELNTRLQPIKERLTNPTWLEIIAEADKAGINLNASYMYNLADPVPKPYSAYGATVLEVLLDVITGQYQVSRVDIVQDAGESLNPYIDIGQVEGAFTMGLGLFSSEEIVFDKKTGKLLTDRTWTYWPPGAKDIPVDFRVTLKKNGTNPIGTLRSKATGEPPFCMSVTLLMALRHALTSARKDAGLPDNWFTFKFSKKGARIHTIFPDCTGHNEASVSHYQSSIDMAQRAASSSFFRPPLADHPGLGVYPKVSRVDIVEDAGESLNPYIDIGQVEGAFTMGLGYYSSEELVFDKKTGKLLTDRTWTYWPPGAKDIPVDFRVTLKKALIQLGP